MLRSKIPDDTERPDHQQYCTTTTNWLETDTIQCSTASYISPEHRDIVWYVEQGKEGFGLVAGEPTWGKATTTGYRKLVVEKVSQQEETGSQGLSF